MIRLKKPLDRKELGQITIIKTKILQICRFTIDVLPSPAKAPGNSGHGIRKGGPRPAEPPLDLIYPTTGDNPPLRVYVFSGTCFSVVPCLITGFKVLHLVRYLVLLRGC